MTIEKVNKPWFTVSHMLATISLGVGLLATVNSTENKVIQTETKQEEIVKNQDEFKRDFKDYQAEQRAVQTQQMQLLHQIKGKLEAK